MTYQGLTEKRVQDTASAYFEERRARTQPQDHPVLVIVGGQPGAGKSQASFLARDELRAMGGFIHIDADRMRERIAIGSSRPTSEETQVDAGRLATKLRSIAIDQRCNLLEEGTFRDPVAIERFIQSHKDKNFAVEMVAVATPREESILGIYQRYERQHAQGDANPRFVREAYHDEAMNGFSRTVAHNERNLDRVRVIDRSGNVLYDSRSRERTGGTAADALIKGQLVSDKRLAAIGAAWSAVQAVAEKRGAGPDHLQRISNNVNEVAAMQKGRIHGHALREQQTNFRVLAADPRFRGHSNEELGKAAYYRGFHEKAQEFAGGSADFKAFDAAMADRSKVRALPGVDDLAVRQLERGPRQTPTAEDGRSL